MLNIAVIIRISKVRILIDMFVDWLKYILKICIISN